MKCLILAAGYATRLYPLTENFPKPLLEVNGKSILDWLIDDVDTSNEINEYIIVTNHKFYEHFVMWAKTRNQKITVIDDGTINNETRLGAVKDIQFAIDKLKIKEDILVLAGDNLLDFSLTKFISYAKSKKASCIMRYFENNFEKLKKTAVLIIDSNDKILDMEEKPSEPKSNWASPPFYYYQQKDVELIKVGIEQGCSVDAPGSFASWLSAQTDVYAMLMPGKRFDIGNLDSYEMVKNTFKHEEKVTI